MNEPALLHVDGTDVPLSGEFRFELQLHLGEGSNVLTLIARDPAGNRTVLPWHVLRDSIAPAAASMELIQIAVPEDGSLYVTGAAGAVEGGATVRIANIATGAVVVVTADAGGAFSALVPGGGTDTLVVSVLDAATNESPAVSISATSAQQTTIQIATPGKGRLTLTRSANFRKSQH